MNARFSQYHTAPTPRTGFRKTQNRQNVGDGCHWTEAYRAGATIMLTSLKNGTLQLCWEYLKVNAVTPWGSFPIRSMAECIEAFGNATIFLTLATNSVYWKVELVNEDWDITAFKSHHRVFSFIWMSFGQENRPGTFYRAMEIISSSVK